MTNFFEHAKIKNVLGLSKENKFKYCFNTAPFPCYIRKGKIEINPDRQKYGKEINFFSETEGQILHNHKQDSQGGYINYSCFTVETITEKELNKLVMIIRDYEKLLYNETI
jgi:hypothetical protein